jgi:hypothetical protein
VTILHEAGNDRTIVTSQAEHGDMGSRLQPTLSAGPENLLTKHHHLTCFYVLDRSDDFAYGIDAPCRQLAADVPSRDHTRNMSNSQ